MYDIGDRDIDLITRTILGEAAREPTQGKAGVAHVIMNRLRAGNYGKSIPDVLFAPKQFEPWNTRRSQLMAYGPQTPGWEEAQNIAKTVARGLAPDPTGGALNFLNRAVSARRGDSAMRPGGWGHNLANPVQFEGSQHTFGTAAGAGTGGGGRIRVASADPNFVPGGASAAPAAAVSPTMPMGGLGGLGGYQPPTGMQTFGDVLQALGMSLLSSPSNNMFQALPQTFTAIQGRRGKEAERAQEAERWATEFGLKRQDLEARRGEQATDNARQAELVRQGQERIDLERLGPTGRMMRQLYPNLREGTPEYIEKFKEVARMGSGDETYGVTPTYETRDGRTYAVQYGSKGGTREREVTGQVQRGEDRIDAGTHYILRDKTTGAERVIPKDVAGVSAAQAEGKLTGEQVAQAPQNIARITAARQELVELRDDPRRPGVSGLEAFFQLHKIPATERYAYAQRFAKAKAGAYTQGLQALQGFGPVTEKEGQAAAKAVEDMELALDDKSLLDAMNRYDKALEAGLQRAQSLLQGRATPAPMTPRPGSAPGVGPGGGTTRKGTTFRVLD
jgi:hypothetical protein